MIKYPFYDPPDKPVDQDGCFRPLDEREFVFFIEGRMKRLRQEIMFAMTFEPPKRKHQPFGDF